MDARSLKPANLTTPFGTSTSRVRSTTERRARLFASERVAQYLCGFGLEDRARAAELAARIVSAAATTGADQPANGPVSSTSDDAITSALRHAQHTVDAFLRAVFGDWQAQVDPLWLHAFVQSHPEAFLADPATARAAADAFGDYRTGALPTTQRFATQRFEPMRAPRWLLGLLAPALATAGLAASVGWSMTAGGFSAAEAVWVVLFGASFVGPAIGLCTALWGTWSKPWRVADEGVELARTALVMPVYHEDPERTFAALAAMQEALEASPGRDYFDIYALSDSRDVTRGADELRAFRRVAELGRERTVRMHYRRRSDNHQQKSGNLAEFFERFGADYCYVVVLDADSLMTAETLVALVRRMQAAPEVGLMQAPLQVMGAQTLLARCQQFTASVSGPLFTRGLAAWAAEHGNYYGHNAIIRVRAFLECAALPSLPGKPPWGGHFLSHDFVEAALLCCGGWQVRMAADLGGSWEQVPQSLPEFVARDRRWCQGNLQHLRIVCARGLVPMSRVHLGLGAWSYVSAPVLIAFVAQGVYVHARAGGPSALGAALWLVATVLALAGPRALGTLACLRNPRQRLQHGGGLTLLASACLEALLSLWLAPLLLWHTCAGLFSIVRGTSARWSAQNRGATLSWPTLLRMQWGATVAGVILGVGSALWSLSVCAWLSPLWLPLALSIPVAAALSSPGLGRLCGALKLFDTAAVQKPDLLMSRVKELQRLTLTDAATRFRDLVLDPILLHAHLRSMRSNAEASTDSTDSSSRLERLRERALRVGPAAMAADELRLLSENEACMRWLHARAWQAWPVEAWRSRAHGYPQES